MDSQIKIIPVVYNRVNHKGGNILSERGTF